MTDAMRAACDRWLADPDSAGAGAAFEAGWYACTEVTEGRMRLLIDALWSTFNLANRPRLPDTAQDNALFHEIARVAQNALAADPPTPPDPLAFRAALGAIIPTADLRPPEEIIRELRGDPPTPTGEATTEEGAGQ